MSKTEYGDGRDDLGFLSHYIIDMACQDKLQRIKANEKTRKKELLERTCTYKNSLCSSKCICGMPISDFKDGPKYKKFKNKKKVHFAGSNPAATQHQVVQESYKLNRSDT